MGADFGSRCQVATSAAGHLPIAADRFGLTWVTVRTAVLTEPRVDELLRAGLWSLHGRGRNPLVDTGNGVGSARLARRLPRDLVSACTHARIDQDRGFHEFGRRLLPLRPSVMGTESTGEAIRLVLETYAGPIILIAVGYAYVWFHKRRYLANEEKLAA